MVLISLVIRVAVIIIILLVIAGYVKWARSVPCGAWVSTSRFPLLSAWPKWSP